MATTSAKDPPTEADDKLEGIDSPADDLGTYPIDAVLIRTEHRTIVGVLGRIETGFIILDPEFQRDFLWDEDRQSRLVESVLMRIPLPVFYFAENRDGKLVIVDGLQRLSTFARFHKGELVLKLPKNQELDGRSFGELSTKLRNRFEDGQLTLFLIDSKVPDRVRMDIFERVNSGVALTRQQMRNALYSGPATRLLRELADNQSFKTATGGSLSRPKHRKDMRDREVVNRFFAFRLLGWESYDADRSYDEFLGDALAKLNALSAAELKVEKSEFIRSMEANHRVFTLHAFRKHTAANEARKPVNLALFDVFSVLLIRWSSQTVIAKKTEIREAFFGLMANRRFSEAITTATASSRNVAARFDLANEALAEVLGDP